MCFFVTLSAKSLSVFQFYVDQLGLFNQPGDFRIFIIEGQHVPHEMLVFAQFFDDLVDGFNMMSVNFFFTST